MIWRTAFLLAIVIFAAFSTFDQLVQKEVERVVSIHVTDKAAHLTDMLSVEAQSLDQLQRASQAPIFLGMAQASNVASINLHRPDGTFYSASEGRMVPASERGQIRLTGEEPHASDARQSQNAKFHTHHHSHDQDAAKLQALAALPVLEPDAIRSVVAENASIVVQVRKLETADGAQLPFARVILPVFDAADANFGIIVFTLSTAHIYAAMAHGADMFGVAFTLFGAVLFGIPAIGFWLQKRLAERRAHDVGFLSRHDALTGLLNRRTFSDEVAARVCAGEIGHVGYVDVDRFKRINDRFGHRIGDGFLMHIGDLLRDAVGEGGLVSRFGGDEFTFALRISSTEDAQQKIEDLRRAAALDIDVDGVLVGASVSIGMAECQITGTVEEALQDAEAALYHAKSQGRNQVAVYKASMGEAAARRRNTEALLRDASMSGGFGLAFQPLVNARSGNTIGYEALLRLSDEAGHPIPPSEFIPLAEEIGLIENIGEWVLFNAMRQVSELDDVSGVSINLSADQFASGRLVDLVKAALQQSNLSADRLELEITESLLLQQDAHVEHQIDALKEMGVSIAMDDFGTGFSSLSTLWRYGFDRIKIDKSFVSALEEAPDRSRQLIDAIIVLGARMGMSITAEGIETAEQGELLATLGCDVLQGFYFGRPAPLDRSAGSDWAVAVS